MYVIDGIRVTDEMVALCTSRILSNADWYEDDVFVNDETAARVYAAMRKLEPAPGAVVNEPSQPLGPEY